jgi:glucose/arabinose dehydrogenase
MQNAPGGFVVGLRDADHDGHAETIERFGTMYQDGKPGGGTGIAVSNDGLYVEADGTIVRYRLRQGSLVPEGQPEVVLTGMPLDGDHPMHPFAIAADGKLFVNSGSASNACQEKNRAVGSPGRTPCPELPTRAGIWRYDARKTNQAFSPHERFAMGARNTVALTVGPDNTLWAVVHGRDQLSDNWPKLYTDVQNNELPAEVLHRVGGGEDLGWPYCYFDSMQDKHVLAPEYGGDGGRAVSGCLLKSRPDGTFPAHWAPEAIVFYTGSAFPNKYRNGAFVSFHGSWNRKPFQAGYLVAFVPFADRKPSGRHEEFATGFAGAHPPVDAADAAHRPMGVAVAPDGTLYVGDDVTGRIWRISYVGS